MDRDSSPEAQSPASKISRKSPMKLSIIKDRERSSSKKKKTPSKS